MRQRIRQAWRFPLLEPWERNLFRAFAILCLVSIPPNLIGTALTEGLSGSGLTVEILGTLQGTLFMLGIFVFARRQRVRLIPTRRMVRTFLVIGLIVGVLAAATAVVLLRLLEADRLGRWGIHLASVTSGPGWELEGTPDAVVLTKSDYPSLAGILLLAVTLGIFITFWPLTWLAFGLCWLLSVVVRALIPTVLRGIHDITPTMAASRATPLPVVDRRWFGPPFTLRWLFQIPDVLDTRQLAAHPQEARARFPWPLYRYALGWQAALSAILGVNIGLNPIFLSGESSLAERMSLAGNVSILIPVATLLWFIFERLNIAIKGPARDFTLYEGLRGRTNGAIITFGTLVLFVRLALREMELDVLVSSMAGYFVQIMVMNALITYVYFNYFERWLVQATVARLPMADVPAEIQPPKGATP